MRVTLLSIHRRRISNFATNQLDIEKPASQTSDSFQVTCLACELFVVARNSACQFVLCYSMGELENPEELDSYDEMVMKCYEADRAEEEAFLAKVNAKERDGESE